MNVKLIILAGLLSLSNSQYKRNGLIAMPGQVPYQLSIVKLKNIILPEPPHFCGGTIILPQWALTTGHCATEIETPDLPVKDFAVIAGKMSLEPNEFTYIKEQMRKIYNVYIHEKYEHKDVRVISVYDIALLNLTEPFILNSGIALARLPTEKEALGNAGIVSGWNFIKNRNITMYELLSHLRWAKLDILGPKTCVTIADQINMKDDLPVSLKLLEENLICTGPLFSAFPICIGDSGGPLVTEDHYRKIIGIVSYVKRLANKIGEGPAFYTRVSTFIPWIKKIVNK